MGPIPSRPSVSEVVNTLQTALSRRSDRRVEPEPLSELCADTPVLSAKKIGKRRRFRTWKRNQKRNYSSPCCHEEEDDGYACVFGKSRPVSTHSLPPAIPVRRYRPAYPPPLTPSSEHRLFIENIEVEGHVVESTYQEEDVEKRHFQRELSTPVILPCGRPHTVFRTVSEPQEPKPERGEPFLGQDDFLESVPEPEVEPEPVPEQEPKQESIKSDPTEEMPPCVCSLPSKNECLCDKRLFETMRPWSKVKLAVLILLVVALAAWLIVFLVVL